MPKPVHEAELEHEWETMLEPRWPASLVKMQKGWDHMLSKNKL
jgi:hypothetical protein